MIIVRPVVFELVEEFSDHLLGLDEFIAESGLQIARFQDNYFCVNEIYPFDIGQDETAWDVLQRSSLEIDKTIEAYVKHISVLFCVRYRIYCHTPDSYCAFITADEEGRLGTYRTFQVSWDILRPVDPRTARTTLGQRPEAQRLLAAAVNASTSAAELTSYVRVLEAAFNLKHNSLKVPLLNFLSTNGLDYTRGEVDDWIRLRHGLSHADREDYVLYDMDATAFIPRIKQAAYDACFNKKRWRHNSWMRKQPHELTTSFSPSRLNVTAGVKLTANVSYCDFFGRFRNLPESAPRSLRGFKALDMIPNLERKFPGLEVAGVLSVTGYRSVRPLDTSRPVDSPASAASPPR